jgi:exopolysaccharide production protein ExoZ
MPGSSGHMFYRATKEFGVVGVELFFAISGFLIHFILMRGVSEYTVFMRRRIRRIVPLAWTCITLAVAIKLTLNIMEEPVITGSTFWDIVANYLLIPGMLPVNSIYDVTWTLSFEMFFYAVCPIIVMAFRALGFHFLARILACFVLILLTLAFPIHYHKIVYFIIGMMAAECFIQFKERPNWSSALGWLTFFMGLPLLIYIQLALGALLPWPAELEKDVRHLVVLAGKSIGFFIVISWVITIKKDQRSILLAQPFQIVGAASYSLYLTHALLMHVLMTIFNKLLPVETYLPTWQFFFQLGLFAGLAIALSCFTYQFIERPFSLDGKWRWPCRNGSTGALPGALVDKQPSPVNGKLRQW